MIFRMDMKNTLTQLLIIGFLVFGTSAFSAEHPELKAFPPQRKGWNDL